jgi:hypothetical protein
MRVTRDVLLVALAMLLVGGWLAAGRVGVGVGLVVGAVVLGVFALARDVDPAAEAEAALHRRTGVPR